jgi:hypothetical protein
VQLELVEQEFATLSLPITESSVACSAAIKTLKTHFPNRCQPPALKPHRRFQAVANFTETPKVSVVSNYRQTARSINSNSVSRKIQSRCFVAILTDNAFSPAAAIGRRFFAFSPKSAHTATRRHKI